MPTYDYHCDACEHEFEHFQGFNDPLLKKCPECGKNKLRRLIGAGGAVVFKGSGFYTTDYRSESYKKSAAAESKSSDGGGSSESKSESKSETKSEAKPAESKSSSAAKENK
jgi:putative FmdB family regulatory protein